MGSLLRDSRKAFVRGLLLFDKKLNLYFVTHDGDNDGKMLLERISTMGRGVKDRVCTVAGNGGRWGAPCAIRSSARQARRNGRRSLRSVTICMVVKERVRVSVMQTRRAALRDGADCGRTVGGESRD